MKATFVILFFLVSLITVSAQKTNPNYDEALAKKLGADEYGMKKYVLVILKTGENTTAGSEETNTSFRGHMENTRLENERTFFAWFKRGISCGRNSYLFQTENYVLKRNLHSEKGNP